MNKEFLYTLLDGMSVSGYEIPLQKKVIAEMKPLCDEIRTDYTGNVISILNPQASFKVLLAAHIDEVGLVVTHIREDGMLHVTTSGGPRIGIYPGHQVMVYGKEGAYGGTVVYNKDLCKADLKAEELVIDIGAKDEADARTYVKEGCPVHPHSYHQEMLNGYLAARGIDDRGCAYIILEALKRAKERGCGIGVYAVTTVGEETNGRGAYWAGARIQPDVAIAVDVTFATDYPGTEAKRSGSVKLGKGPVLCNAPYGTPKLQELLEVCAGTDIPIQVETSTERTYTDADKLHMSGLGVPAALVSLPLRYMHCPSEVCAVSDVENSIELLTRFLCTIGPDTNLDPFADN